MRRFIGGVMVVVVLTGCSQSTEDICKQTDQLLRDSGQSGFTDVGYLGCLKLSPKEAAQSLYSLRDALGKQSIEKKSRAEVENILHNADVGNLIKQLGNPSSLSYDNTRALYQRGKSIEYGSSNVVSVGYYANGINAEDRDPERLLANLKRFILLEEGDYYFSWDEISDDMFGLTDKDVSLYVVVRDGKIVERLVRFPKYFWQSWFES